MNNTKAVKFLEDVVVVEEFELGESIENVSMADAIYATKLAELQTLQWVQGGAAQEAVTARIKELEHSLHHVKKAH